MFSQGTGNPDSRIPTNRNSYVQCIESCKRIFKEPMIKVWLHGTSVTPLTHNYLKFITKEEKTMYPGLIWSITKLPWSDTPSDAQR